ncbi:class I SAM-dependent methyltransferase [Nocardia terpenica]|uniref:SAM-dependent methyltransferase n=1 Tax=Nocardia terpenica TaxID=455432 RepID=A0A291RM22_9NOCA|nr:class I SAM-dependent methyltransferase [Nocardia terpenica]ATL68340.1 SAM-dependent methyltransferase [Nocardia terpenica]
MTAAAEHYDRLLAEHLTWMLGGDIEALATAQADLLRRLGLGARPEERATAVDLGSGSGPQTLALTRLGYASVTAVDTSTALLDELADHARRSGAGDAVHLVHSDIRGVLPGLADAGSVAAVVCMGDTLPHLLARSDVVHLVSEVAEALRPGGSFVVTYRDLTAELHGPDRFMPVRSTADRILTCFLDYVDDDTVLVHDLLHTRQQDGWILTTGSYPKLRLSHRWLSEQCRAAGLAIRHDDAGPGGLRTLHAVKP